MDTPDSSNRTSKAVPRERAHMRRRGRDMPARLEPPAPPAAARQRMGIGIGIGDRGHVCGRPRARSVSSGRSHESRGAGRPGSVHPAWTGRRPEPCRATPPNLLDPSFVCPRKRRARRGRRRLPSVDRLKYPLSLFFFYCEPVPVRPEAAVPAIDVAHLSAQQQTEFLRLCSPTSGSGESPTSAAASEWDKAPRALLLAASSTALCPRPRPPAWKMLRPVRRLHHHHWCVRATAAQAQRVADRVDFSLQCPFVNVQAQCRHHYSGPGPGTS